ncbi:hypothetical protein DRN97_05495 [Methanosarcinales archaeon]|nr:MAG: hypothetical protein DRN97_05495 [Methanosarcinales archaeon]
MEGSIEEQEGKRSKSKRNNGIPFAHHRAGSILPVVENGMVVGIVSIQDLLRRKPECIREFYS